MLLDIPDILTGQIINVETRKTGRKGLKKFVRDVIRAKHHKIVISKKVSFALGIIRLCYFKAERGLKLKS